MEIVSAERDDRQPEASDEAARKRAAVETYARNQAALRRTARRYSLCADDAEDALQRGLEILLRKAPSDDPRELIKWTQTVVKHEALAIRRERERTFAGPAAAAAKPGHEDWVSQLPAVGDGPAERAERREEMARSREALQALKPHELRTLTLLAEGYSYAEIGEITGYSRTKVNRCLAEGRERFRKLISRSEDGRLCTEMQPLISAFCDGEAGPEEVVKVREHLRACARCRATLRAYRAAPAAAGALAPALPVARSLLQRAHHALSNLAARAGGEPGSPPAGASGGGAGFTALAKVAAVCIGAAGTGGACVALGLAPSPLGRSPQPSQEPPGLQRQADVPTPRSQASAVEYAPAPEPAASKPSPKPQRPQTRDRALEETEPVAGEPATSGSGALEPAPPPPPEPEPATEPAPTASSAGGSPAGEFGP